MKSIVLFSSLFIAILFVQATIIEGNPVKESRGIDFFPGSWNEALELAKKEDKLIFLDAYASWCGPCKSMQKKVFPTDKVGEYFNARFINVKIDMEKGGLIREGMILRKDGKRVGKAVVSRASKDSWLCRPV